MTCASGINLCLPEDILVLLHKVNRRTYLQPPIVSRMLSAPMLDLRIQDQGTGLEEAANTRDVAAVRTKDFLRSIAKLALGGLGVHSAAEARRSQGLLQTAPEMEAERYLRTETDARAPVFHEPGQRGRHVAHNS